MEDRLAEVRGLFDPAPGLIYLDTATYGLPPRPTVEVMHQALANWQSGRANWVTDWDMRGEDCRRAFADLTGLASESIALIPAVSVGVGLVTAHLTERDEVVTSDDEFLSVLYPALVAARERGARIREVPFDRLFESVGPQTTLVAFSLVQSQGGRTARSREIVDAAQRVGARTLVDATHALPFVAVDPRADFVACAAYKHLLCPRGVAFLYVAPRQWDTVAPWLANWRSASQPYGSHYGGPLSLTDGAARFDISLAWFPWVGAAASLRLLVDWQKRGLLDEPVRLVRRLADRLGLPEPVGSVLGVPVRDLGAIARQLADRGIKAAVRAGGVRVATHVYNTPEQIDTATQALEQFVLQHAV